ncbi:adenylate/guanylate cyclase domain-containing protein [Mesorhizobium sp. BAC0120]|uniref:adenylate/guanylate cyclase domain-containing protein n=1 Tax=Mesorhizobium sp. BAC0120 TaxID=3090670 RepID=UPI00298CBD45|nr:adenylate/guanylate cyclase domain-containing protein [Mesorhizobium sp. BAC0120]MDW6020444.1 adenylate/guanylate cyclase domain-containing protein [Mesorhizobium sp. BAC0120]
MNGGDQKPGRATSVEAHTSKPSSLGRKPDDKAAFGIKTKLFMALGGMAMLTVGASAIAWYAFTDIERSVTRITAESVVGMATSLRLAERSAEITATAPALIASRSEEERLQEQQRLVLRLNEISAVTDELKPTGMALARVSNLKEIEGKIADELKRLNGAVSKRLRLSAQREAAVSDLAVVQTSFQDALEPLVDDAGFNLVITSQDVTAKSKDAITGLVEGGVNTLQALLTLRSEGNLAAGLLGEAAHVDDPALIQPLRERFAAAVAAMQKSLEALPQSSENGRLREASDALVVLGGSADNVFEVRLQELRVPLETRQPVQAKRQRMAAAVEAAHRTLLDTLAPMVDDAGFELVTASEGVAAKSTEAITNLVEGGVNALQVLLTLRAEGNLAAGLLNQAAGITDPASLKPLRERFVAAASHAEKLLSQLPSSVDSSALKGLTEKLIAFGTAADNIFDARSEELHQAELAQTSLQANNSLVLSLGKEVSDLVVTAQNNSDAAAIRGAGAIANGRLLLFLITALSVAGAVVIAILYVVPGVVRPIESITSAMSGLAAGDTSIDVPGRGRSDEIGRMADALGVFRDTAIEVQKSNQREIREGRRRLAVAMESISEALSLYDAEDRLVVCNSKYRTLLYPGDMAAEISPGMAFESIVRRAAERGYVKDAEGRVDEWVRERIARHRNPSDPHIQQRGDGRWILVSERKTDDGGTVAVYSDITELKLRENQLADKSRALEQLSNQLAKYLSPQVYESIFSGRQEVKIASRRKKLTVFFSDIAGFTETAERLQSEDLTRLLNHYLTEMSQIALSYGATIDKYVGDAIVIFFGDPETRGVKEDAIACVEMALAMRKKMHELQDVWRASGIERPLQCRIGINTGFCTVGNFGSEDRMDYTIIGGGVNLASRLEAAATPGEILISYETFANVRDRIGCEERGHISVKGIAYPVATYQVVDTYENLVTDKLVIHEERPNLKLDLNLVAMSTQDRGQAAAVLREALNRLSALDRATAGPHEAK